VEFLPLSSNRLVLLKDAEAEMGMHGKMSTILGSERGIESESGR